MLLRYKRPWFLRKRTPHRLRRHDYRKWELAEAWALDVLSIRVVVGPPHFFSRCEQSRSLLTWRVLLRALTSVRLLGVFVPLWMSWIHVVVDILEPDSGGVPPLTGAWARH
jgi:hypothetical protein